MDLLGILLLGLIGGVFIGAAVGWRAGCEERDAEWLGGLRAAVGPRPDPSDEAGA